MHRRGRHCQLKRTLRGIVGPHTVVFAVGYAVYGNAVDRAFCYPSAIPFAFREPHFRCGGNNGNGNRPLFRHSRFQFFRIRVEIDINVSRRVFHGIHKLNAGVQYYGIVLIRKIGIFLRDVHDSRIAVDRESVEHFGAGVVFRGSPVGEYGVIRRYTRPAGVILRCRVKFEEGDIENALRQQGGVVIRQPVAVGVGVEFIEGGVGQFFAVYHGGGNVEHIGELRLIAFPGVFRVGVGKQIALRAFLRFSGCYPGGSNRRRTDGAVLLEHGNDGCIGVYGDFGGIAAQIYRSAPAARKHRQTVGVVAVVGFGFNRHGIAGADGNGAVFAAERHRSVFGFRRAYGRGFRRFQRDVHERHGTRNGGRRDKHRKGACQYSAFHFASLLFDFRV